MVDRQARPEGQGHGKGDETPRRADAEAGRAIPAVMEGAAGVLLEGDPATGRPDGTAMSALPTHEGIIGSRASGGKPVEEKPGR